MRWALAALQAAVTLSWQTYAYFQPRLLERFGFTALSGLLGWYLAFAGSTLAPLAGDASDRLVRSGGSRFPVVRAGVALAGASFLAVALTAHAEPTSAVRWVVPLFVAVWIAGMTCFQAPALAILRDDGGTTVAAAVTPVVVATVAPTALWPWIEPLLARAGGSLSFLAGGIAVVAAATVLGRSVPTVARDPTAPSAEGVGLHVPVLCGLVSAAAAVAATELVPAVLPGSAQITAALVGAAAAIAAIAISRSSGATNGVAPLVLGAAVTVVARLVAPWCTAGLAADAVAVVAGAGLGLNLATALPFALSASPAGRAGLVTGLYVAGAVAGSIVVRAVLGG